MARAPQLGVQQSPTARPKPRRRPGTGNVYKRADGRWEGRLRIDGKLYRVYARTERAAEHEVAALRAKIAGGLVAPPNSETVAAYLTRWLEVTRPPAVAPKTHISYSQHVRDYLIPSLGKIRLDRLEPSEVQRMITGLSERGLSPATIQRIRATLRAALSIALQWGLVVRNVAKLVTLPSVRHDEIQPFTSAEIRLFLSAIENHSLRALYVLALATGLRQSELLGLRWEDVDFEAGWVTVRQQLQRIAGQTVVSQPKTERSRRRIALSSVARHAFEEQRDRQQVWRTQFTVSEEESGLVFTTALGQPLSAGRAYHDLKKICVRNGIRNVRFHDLRHSAASLLISQGASLKEVMDTLGHSQLALTAQTYGHLYDESRKEVAAMMDRALAF